MPHWTLAAALIAISVLSAGHALIHKRDPRASLGWIVACLAIPGAGALAYWFFGVNRIRTRAHKLGDRWPITEDVDFERGESRDLGEDAPEHLSELERIAERVTGKPLVGGNQVDPLHNGEEAYPAMLAAIREATETVFLSTYIFDIDGTGKLFIEALSGAKERGVDVRVLVDGMGEWSSLNRASTTLMARGVPNARFLPPTLIPPTFYLNLRNHRKILVVDHREGFTGGMNISHDHMAEDATNPRLIRDMHFRVRGPVVTQLEMAFLEDWYFATEKTPPRPEPAELERAGDAFCRGIVDGPNEDMDRLKWILLGAVSAAERTIHLMTPYFVPDREMIAALTTACLRGVDVRLILPEKSDHPWVDWATQSMLWEVLAHGVRVFRQPAPFVHTKLFLIDDHYAQIGSANLDPRSMRLNFEFNLEVHDRDFAQKLYEYFESMLETSTEVYVAALDRRSLWCKLRDSSIWLFSPYL